MAVRVFEFRVWVDVERVAVAVQHPVRRGVRATVPLRNLRLQGLKPRSIRAGNVGAESPDLLKRKAFGAELATVGVRLARRWVIARGAKSA